MIAIVEYGMGNGGSLLNMVRRVGGTAIVTSAVEEVCAADKLMLPGVGAFDAGISQLSESGLSAALRQRVLGEKVPIFCICLGMQIITRSSEEGTLPGLGWIDGTTVRLRLPQDLHLRVPHMGWNTVRVEKDSPVVAAMPPESRFYFVHSYHVQCAAQSDVLMTTEYGVRFVSALQRDNIVATQFHPEKSHRFGLTLIRNFVGL